MVGYIVLRTRSVIIMKKLYSITLYIFIVLCMIFTLKLLYEGNQIVVGSVLSSLIIPLVNKHILK